MYPPTHTRERVFGFGFRLESLLEYLFDRGFELPLRFTLARSFFQLRPRALGIAVLLDVNKGCNERAEQGCPTGNSA